MRTDAYHEAVPGHHLQNAIAQEIQDLPFFRRVVPFTAYMEGWALYAEQLAWEMGFEKNPLDNLGRLQLEMFRAVRLVVDTGIHSKRWTREQAIDYMESCAPGASPRRRSPPPGSCSKRARPRARGSTAGPWRGGP